MSINYAAHLNPRFVPDRVAGGDIVGLEDESLVSPMQAYERRSSYELLMQAYHEGEEFLAAFLFQWGKAAMSFTASQEPSTDESFTVKTSYHRQVPHGRSRCVNDTLVFISNASSVRSCRELYTFDPSIVEDSEHLHYDKMIRTLRLLPVIHSEEPFAVFQPDGVLALINRR